MTAPSPEFDYSLASDDELDLVASESADARAIRSAEREIVVRQVEGAYAGAGGGLATVRAVLAEARHRASQPGAPGADFWAAALPGLEWLETAAAAAGTDRERLGVVLDLAGAFAASAIVQHVVLRLRDGG